MSLKIMKFFMVIVLLTTGLFACAKPDPKPDPDPDPDEPGELSASYLGVLGNTGGNLANGGYYAESNGWIYFSEALSFSKLTKMKADGSDKTLLSNDLDIGMINVIGDWVYYSPGSRFGAGPIVRIKTDGSSREVIESNIVRSLAVKGNYLYYVTGDLKLIRSKSDGTEKTLLVDDNVTDLALSGQWLIYTHLVADKQTGNMTEEIMKVRLDGELTSKLEGSVCSGKMIADEQAIYCSTHSGIIKIMTDGSGSSEILLGERPFFLNMTQDRFIYSASDSIVSVTLTGQSKMVLSTTKSPDNLNIAGNWLYYYNSPSWDKAYRVTLDGKLQESFSDKLLVDPSSPAPKIPDLLPHSESWVLMIDGWTYYTIPGGTIRKISGTQNETVFPFESNTMVQVGDWIYFTEWTTTFTKSIDRIKTDGTQFGRLTDDSVTRMIVKEDWIYYTKTNGLLYRMKTNGSSNVKLSNDRISFIVIEGDWIYYTVESGTSSGEGVEPNYTSSDIHRMKLDGSQAQKLYTGSAWSIVSDGTGLFFTKKDGDQWSLWKMGYEGEEQTLIKNEFYSIRAVSSGWIYTTTAATERTIAITRIKTDGSETENLVTLSSDNTLIEIIGNKIYYIDYKDGNSQIHCMDLDGQNQQLIVS